MLIENLVAVAERRGAGVAVIDGSVRTTYAELLRLADCVADALRESGVAPGDRVALVLENGPEYVAVLYGIFAAGAIAVPLNTAARADDLLGWLRHSGASWAFVSAAHEQALARSADTTRLIGPHLWNDITRRGAASSVRYRAKPDDPAMILYTSGTTGQPKGVTLSHRNLAANTASILRTSISGPTTES